MKDDTILALLSPAEVYIYGYKSALEAAPLAIRSFLERNPDGRVFIIETD